MFPNPLIKPAKVFRFHYRKGNLRLDLQNQYTIFLLISVKISLNILIDMFFQRSDLKTPILACFPSEILTCTVIKVNLKKLSTLAAAKTDASTTIDITLETSLIYLRANEICSTIFPDFRYDNSLIVFNGKVQCRNGMCFEKLCVHRKTFQFFIRSACQCPQCTSTCQVRNIPFDQTTYSFLLKCDRMIYTFRETNVLSR